jgi:hypothetical protein
MYRRSYRFVSLLVLIALVAGVHASAQAAASPSQSLATDKAVSLAYFYKPPDNSGASALAQNFGTFILTHADESFRDQLIAQGVKTPILQYIGFDEIQDPGSCTASPQRNQVTYQPGDFCDISQNHSDWFLLDANGDRIQTDNWYVMDPGNSGWRKFWLTRAEQSQQQFGWQGVFLDNVEASLARRVQENGVPVKYPDDASYQTAIAGFLKYLSANYFKPNNVPLLANIISRRGTDAWQKYLQFLNGAMEETWAVDWHTGYLDVDSWNADLARAEQAQQMGKYEILVSQGDQGDTNRQNFAYASYLLVANGMASFRYTNASSYRQVWIYPNYDIDLGAPLGPRYQVGEQWRRDFSKGYVLVNPADHTATISTSPKDPPDSPAVVTYDNKDSALAYSAGWRERSNSKAYDNSFEVTRRRRASVTLKFSGQSFSVLYTSGPRNGRMIVFVDGAKVGAFSQKTAHQRMQRKWSYSGQLGTGTHKLKLVFAGPSDSKATLDGVIVNQ